MHEKEEILVKRTIFMLWKLGFRINCVFVQKVSFLTKFSFLPEGQSVFTDRVRSTRWEVIFSLCLSVHTCGGGGGPWPGPDWGYPGHVQMRGYRTTYGVLDTPQLGMPLAFTQEDFLV